MCFWILKDQNGGHWTPEENLGIIILVIGQTWSALVVP
jgi:hypothetical protein